jgi:hypothetical protein
MNWRAKRRIAISVLLFFVFPLCSLGADDVPWKHDLGITLNTIRAARCGRPPDQYRFQSFIYEPWRDHGKTLPTGADLPLLGSIRGSMIHQAKD